MAHTVTFCSGYGKCGEDKTRHTTTTVVLDHKKLHKMMVKPFFKAEEEFIGEDGVLTGWEVESRKTIINDDKPVHVSAAILQWSKILLIE